MSVLTLSKNKFITLTCKEINDLYPEFDSKESYVDAKKIKAITGFDFEWPHTESGAREAKKELYAILTAYEKNKRNENISSVTPVEDKLLNKNTSETVNNEEKENNKMNTNNNMVVNNTQTPLNNFIDSNADLSKIKLTMNGLGIQGKDGTIKTYKNGKIIDVTQFSFQGDSTNSFVFLLPAKKVKAGDLIVNNGTFVFVVSDDGNMITAVDFENNSQRTIIRQQHALIPFSFVTKVYSPFSGSGKMSNMLMLPLMMMNSNNSGGGMMNNMMQMMMMNKMLKSVNDEKADNDNDGDDDIFGDMNKMFNID